MRIIELNERNKTNLLESLLKRSPNSYGEYEETVNEMIRQVRARGDEALFEYTQKFDGCRLTAETVKVSQEEIRQAYREVSPEFLEVMKNPPPTLPAS